MDLCKPSFDFTTNQPDPTTQGFTPTKKACGDVAAGYTSIMLTGNFTNPAASGIIVGQGIDVKIVGPDGKTAVATCTTSAGDQVPVKCSKSGSLSVSGAYSVIYDGGGAVSFAGTISIS